MSEILPITGRHLALHGSKLTKCNVLHVNHDLPDVHALNDLLSKAGARVTFIPIPYFERRAPTAASVSWRPAFLRDCIVPRLRNLAEPTYVVDDGGYVAEATASADHGGAVRLVVEQTPFGERVARKALLEERLSVRVVSCARTTLKCRVEASFLAVRFTELISEFAVRAGGYLHDGSVVILGYGILGRPLAHRLARAYECKVTIVEPDPVIRDVAERDGFSAVEGVSDLVHVGAIDHIVGASGVPSLSWPGLMALLNGREQLYLASVSSGEIEFSEVLREACARSQTGDIGLATEPWGLRVTTATGVVNLLADGRPVNFFERLRYSLPVPVADLSNYRLMEALTVMMDSPSSETPGITAWGGADCDHPGMRRDGDVLGEFRRGGARDAGEVVAHGREVMYEVHPEEDRLRMKNYSAALSAIAFPAPPCAPKE